jgi:hypothetical protein
MVPLGFFITFLAWAAFAIAAIGLFFWAARWFPRQRWFAPTLLLLFLFLVLLARQTKWAVVVLVLLLVVGSGFIPRRR